MCLISDTNTHLVSFLNALEMRGETCRSGGCWAQGWELDLFSVPLLPCWVILGTSFPLSRTVFPLSFSRLGWDLQVSFFTDPRLPLHPVNSRAPDWTWHPDGCHLLPHPQHSPSAGDATKYGSTEIKNMQLRQMPFLEEWVVDPTGGCCLALYPIRIPWELQVSHSSLRGFLCFQELARSLQNSKAFLLKVTLSVLQQQKPCKLKVCIKNSKGRGSLGRTSFSWAAPLRFTKEIWLCLWWWA